MVFAAAIIGCGGSIPGSKNFWESFFIKKKKHLNFRNANRPKTWRTVFFSYLLWNHIFLTSLPEWSLIHLFLFETAKTIYTAYLMSEGWLTLFRMSSLVRLLMIASSNDQSSNKLLVKHTGPILKQITAIIKSYARLYNVDLNWHNLADSKYEKKRTWILMLTLTPYTSPME